MNEPPSKTPDLSGAIEKHDINRPPMREAVTETPDLSPATMHFQILLAGTLIFLGVLFWIVQMPRTNTDERIFVGILAVGCYVALVSVVLGHKVLNPGRTAQSRLEERDQG